MKLMTKELELKIPMVGADTETPLENRTAMVKFFNPCGAATWYVIEYDPQQKLCFGYADLFGDESCAEYGSFSLTELEEITLPFGLKIERDLHFQPKTMKEILKNRY